VRVIARFRPPTAPAPGSTPGRGEPSLNDLNNKFRTPAKRGSATYSSVSLARALSSPQPGILDDGYVSSPAPSASFTNFDIDFKDERTVELVGLPQPGVPSTPSSTPGAHSPHPSGGASSLQRATYTLDRVFPPSATQEEIFEAVARGPLQDVLEGYNGTILAYGQTGSGKTHSMFGPKFADALAVGGVGALSKAAQQQVPTSRMGTGADRGLIPRCAEALFDGIQQLRDVEEVVISCSFLEIYNEQIRDLLNPGATSGASGGAALRIRELPTGEVYVQGLTEEFVGDAGEILTCVAEGERNRAVTSTNVNEVSSRSHAILILSVKQTARDRSIKMGRLFLADLAGSERVGLTGATGQTLEEAKRINQSLSALGNCIAALTEKRRSHIPYRDSTLTFLLKESLGGNCKTTVLFCCSSDAPNALETQSTLRFAMRLKKMKNSAKINKLRSVAELEMLLLATQKELAGAVALNTPFINLLCTVERLIMKIDPQENVIFDATRIATAIEALKCFVTGDAETKTPEDSATSKQSRNFDVVDYPTVETDEKELFAPKADDDDDDADEASKFWGAETQDDDFSQPTIQPSSSEPDHQGRAPDETPALSSFAISVPKLTVNTQNDDDTKTNETDFISNATADSHAFDNENDNDDDFSVDSKPPRLSEVEIDTDTGLFRGFSFVSPSFLMAKSKADMASPKGEDTTQLDELRRLVEDLRSEPIDMQDIASQASSEVGAAAAASEEPETERERALKAQVVSLKQTVRRLQDTVDTLRQTWKAHLDMMLESQLGQPSKSISVKTDSITKESSTSVQPPRIVRPLRPSVASKEPPQSSNRRESLESSLQLIRSINGLGAGVATPVDASEYSILHWGNVSLPPVLKGILRCGYMWLCKLSLFRRESWKKVLYIVMIRDDRIWLEQFKLEPAMPLSHLSFIDPIVRVYNMPVARVPGAVTPITDSSQLSAVDGGNDSVYFGPSNSAFVSSDPKERFQLTSTCVLRVLPLPTKQPPPEMHRAETTNPTEVGGPGTEISMRSSHLAYKYRFEIHDSARRQTLSLAVDSKIELDLWLDFLAAMIRRVNEDGVLKVSSQQVARLEVEAETFLRAALEADEIVPATTDQPASSQ